MSTNKHPRTRSHTSSPLPSLHPPSVPRAHWFSSTCIMASNKADLTTATNTPPRRPAPSPMNFSSTTTTTSETAPLLQREDPPPRYSAIEPAWDVPLDNPAAGHTANLTTTHTAPAPPGQTSLASPGSTQSYSFPPGWWSWVPGPAQLFPPGLEHLNNVSSLSIYKKGRKFYIKRSVDVLYTTRPLKDTKGTAIYRVQNNANLDVLQLTSTTKKESILSPYFLHVEVSFPPGNVVGVVQGSGSKYTGHNPSGDLLFVVHKESTSCCKKPNFRVETKETLPLGALEWVRAPGCCCRDRNIMEICFPVELDLRWKSLLLGGALVLRSENW